MYEEMPRMPKGNYEGYVNKASSVTIFQRWNKNDGDGYKILSDGKLKQQTILRKFTNVEY